MFPLRSARWLLGASRSELFSTLPLKSLTSDTRTETLCYTSSMKPTHWEVKAHCAVFTAPHIHLRSFISTFSLVLTLIETQFKGPTLWELSCKHRVICVFCFQLWEIDSAADQNHEQQHLHRDSIVRVSFALFQATCPLMWAFLFSMRAGVVHQEDPRTPSVTPLTCCRSFCSSGTAHPVPPCTKEQVHTTHTVYRLLQRCFIHRLQKKKASLKQTSWWEEMLPEDRAAVPMTRTTRKQNP